MWSLLIQPDGKLVAGSDELLGSESVLLARYNVDGSLDAGFGDGGEVTEPRGLTAFALGIQADGMIVTAGDTDPRFRSKFVLARFNTDGTVDGSFGEGGIVATRIGSGGNLAEAHALAIQPNGRLIAAGELEFGSRTNVVLARYLP